MRGVMRGVGRAVQQVDIAIDEHAFPWHFDIVEEHDAIHFLEARAERVVETRAAEVEAVAAEEAQAGGAAGDGEGDGERAVVFGVLAEAWGVDRDIVGQGPQGGQHARAAHDQAGAGFAHHAQRGAFLKVEVAGDVPAALEVDQRVGQDDVVLADVFVVAADVVAEFRSAAREVVGRGGPGGEGHVHEVGRTAHHAACGARPVQHHDAARFEFFAGAGDDEGQSDAVAGGGRRVSHFVAEFRVALHVVQRGDGAGAVGETWMGGHVLHALTAQPDLALLFLQAG